MTAGSQSITATAIGASGLTGGTNVTVSATTTTAQSKVSQPSTGSSVKWTLSDLAGHRIPLASSPETCFFQQRGVRTVIPTGENQLRRYFQSRVGLPGQTTSEENARLKRTVAEVTLDKVLAEGLGGKKQNN
jgi:hypothetical protein